METKVNSGAIFRNDKKTKKYTRQAFDRDPEHFKKLLALQTGRHIPRPLS